MKNYITSGLMLGLLALAMIPATALSQSEEDAYRFSNRSPAVGARLMGMAGTSTAGIGDWGAVFSNPAGLGYVKESHLVGAFGMVNVQNDASLSLNGFAGSQDMFSSSAGGLSNFGYVYRAPTAQGALSFGIGFNRTTVFDRVVGFSGENGNNSFTDFLMPLASEFTISDNDGDDGIAGTEDDFRDFDFDRTLSFLGFETFGIDFDEGLYNAGNAVPFLPAAITGTMEQTGEAVERGGVSELSFGGAIEASEGLMVGASLNFNFGAYQYDRIFEEWDVNDANDGTGGTTDYAGLRLDEELESEMFGVNFRVGASAQLGNGLRLGGSIETPTVMTIDERFSSTLTTEFDNGENYLESYGPVGGVPYTVTTPWRVGLGIAGDLGNLRLAADLEFLDWSQMRMEDRDGIEEVYFDDINRSIRDNFKGVANMRFGAEYAMNALTLRGGLAVQPSPLDTDDSESTTRDRGFLSLGFGYDMNESLQLNAGLLLEGFEDQYSPYTEVQDAPLVDETIARSRLSIGVKIKI